MLIYLRNTYAIYSGSATNIVYKGSPLKFLINSCQVVYNYMYNNCLTCYLNIIFESQVCLIEDYVCVTNTLSRRPIEMRLHINRSLTSCAIEYR